MQPTIGTQLKIVNLLNLDEEILLHIGLSRLWTVPPVYVGHVSSHSQVCLLRPTHGGYFECPCVAELWAGLLQCDAGQLFDQLALSCCLVVFLCNRVRPCPVTQQVSAANRGNFKKGATRGRYFYLEELRQLGLVVKETSDILPRLCLFQQDNVNALSTYVWDSCLLNVRAGLMSWPLFSPNVYPTAQIQWRIWQRRPQTYEQFKSCNKQD